MQRRAATPTHSGWSLLALGVLMAILCAPDEPWLKLVAIFGVFPVLMLVLGASDVPRGIAGATLRKLGVLSYAIYMMHGPVLFAWLTFYMTPEVRETESVLVAIPLLAAVVLASWAADRWARRTDPGPDHAVPARSQDAPAVRLRRQSRGAGANPTSAP